ncbi:pilin [Patescibacteria group bacterium]|nr:pilin [Patescibacteria group bacterium]
MILEQINKNKILFKIITVSVFVLFLFNMSVAYGAGIVPACASNPTGCGFDDMLILAQNIITFILYIAATIAVIMFTYAGILYLTASGKSGQIEQAHKIFLNVLIGFIIVLSAWLVINTIANALLDKSNFKTYLE